MPLIYNIKKASNLKNPTDPECIGQHLNILPMAKNEN